MKPIRFKGGNAVYAKDQPEYHSLPVHQTKEGEVISCWKFSLLERICILLGNKLWLHTLTFNQPLQPHRLSLDDPEAVKSYLDNHDSPNDPTKEAA